MDFVETRYGKYSVAKGKFLVIWITGMIGDCIAEITRVKPLKMKVEESGPFAHLRDGDYIIREPQTVEFQADVDNDTNNFLERAEREKFDVITGLHSMGIKDGKLHYIHPPKEIKEE